MEADLHVQRGGIPQCGCEEEDEGQNQYNSEGLASIVLTGVYEGCNRSARPAKFMLELSEEEKKEMGFSV